MRKFMALLVLMMAVPAAANAQQARPDTRGITLASSIEFLVASKDELNASAEQIAKLEEIGQKFNAETAKLRKDLLKIRDELNAGGNRQLIFAKVQPIREEMQKHDDAAIAAALQVLSAGQQEIARQLIASRSETVTRGGQKAVK